MVAGVDLLGLTELTLRASQTLDGGVGDLGDLARLLVNCHLHFLGFMETASRDYELLPTSHRA